MADRASSGLLEGLRIGPLGIPVRVTTEDPEGLGDRASLFGDTVYVPSGDPNSVPHETLHANIRRLEMLLPGGVPAEGLLSRASEAAYGDRSQYMNPFERVAYGYQEGVTGQPDAAYREAVAANKPAGLSLRGILNLLGRGAEAGGRALGRAQRPK